MFHLKSGHFFIHIPKNGGRALERALGPVASYPFETMQQDFGITRAEAEIMRTGPGFEHAALGRVSPGHLPLWLLREHCPRTWALFERTSSFATTRAPRDRFLSAVMQRLSEFRGSGPLRADSPLVREEAKAVCEWLSARERIWDMTYVHFTRQSDYVFLDGQRRVTRLFPMERMDALERWLAVECGLRVAVSHGFARRQPKRWARPVLPLARTAARRLLPLGLRQRIHPLWVNSRLFDAAAGKYGEADLGPDVETFISDYYRTDAELHRAALAETAPAASLRDGSAEADRRVLP